MVPILSEERIEKINKYKFKEDRIRSILSESLLKYMLCKHYRILLEQINFRYNEYGKPFLTEPNNIYFNISHSGQWIICGSSDTPIGIDVEGRVEETMSIANMFFTENEYDYIKSQFPVEQNDTFCKIWTLKESYIKCIGKGLSIPLDSFRFEFHKDGIKMYNNNILNTDYVFKSKKIYDNYHVSVCTMKKDCDIWDDNINIISVNNLLSWKNNKLTSRNNHL